MKKRSLQAVFARDVSFFFVLRDVAFEAFQPFQEGNTSPPLRFRKCDVEPLGRFMRNVSILSRFASSFQSCFN